MIRVKTEEQIERIGRAGRIVAACHQEIAKRLRSGVTTMEIDKFAEAFMNNQGARAAQKGYRGYPFATCASVNDVVCHGFPTHVPLRNGDVITIDMVAELDGWMGDSAWTYAIGTPSAEVMKLMKATKQALLLGIEQAVAGNKLGDIAHAVQKVADQEDYAVVESFVGHGIGRDMHEEPTVNHTGKAGSGKRLRKGMVITIEPIFTMGRPDVYLDKDGWTARSIDGAWSAQYEHTIAITEGKPIILTSL
ncbi:methionine aminopeptidase [Paenibacillus baekrokdamisoli]|uniref:Methionine aminopeptidase n=1 Tax=Paenibacillus baekrokdamisoli TaxID=1712516 RepID=A0A3G9J321_9BACL|nr:type I methionyl aminopeptidase [Paenibacillus baekrokdamisoli]MBB3068222.1 methionyl aminopeptidase [Paenibacillus baekrokdamisoli]BBH22735.1 methionine aminopeptidase [Paenibacillus baekrokdamisoli]